MSSGPRIVVDERERNSGLAEFLKREGASVEFSQLVVGDYLVSSETAVERKSIRDLLSSIYDGRLYIQCASLVKHFAKPVVLLQGDLRELWEIPEGADDARLREVRRRPGLVYNSLAAVMLEFRIPVVNVSSPEDGAHLLIALAKRSAELGMSSGPLLRKIKKQNSIYIQQLTLLSSLPGVGDKLASRMLQKFKTPQKALNASAAELATISGFGLARALRIRKMLDSAETLGDKSALQRGLFGF